MHTSAIHSSALVLALALGTTKVGADIEQQPQASRSKYQDYRVAAGTYLAIELRTPLSSNTAVKGDAVDGRLVLPLTVDGRELVPAGATVLGTVAEAVPAGKKQQGRLAFAFHIIEHPQTGSRATIRGTVLTFASDPPKKGDVYPELRLERGLDASVSLLAPLTVRIPAPK